MKNTIKRILLCKRISNEKFIEIDLADDQCFDNSMRNRLMQRVSPVLTSVSTKAAGCHHTMYFPVVQAAAVKLGDQNVVFELIDVIKASPSIKYN